MFFFRSVLAIIGLLFFNINLRIDLLNIFKNLVRILIKILLTLQMNLVRREPYEILFYL